MNKQIDIMGPQRGGESTPEKDDRTEDKRRDQNEIFEEHESGSGKFYLALGIVALLVAVGAALYIIYRGNSDKKADQAAATSLTATATASAETSATATASAASETTTTTSTFKYTDESIRIVNGNGINGEAARIKKLLEDDGYKIASIANASKTYDQTMIFYKSGQEDLANALKDAIKGEYVATPEQSDTTVGTYDAIIALGKK